MVKAGLVVLELDGRHLDLLPLVLVALLQLEDVLVEEATVDADLLERVGLGRLEAEDAQGADVRLRRRAAALRRRAAGKSIDLLR